jgi:hypothetical protein
MANHVHNFKTGVWRNSTETAFEKPTIDIRIRVKNNL